MKKQFFGMFILLFFLLIPVKAYASVRVYIEGYNKTLATADVDATTFLEAIQKCAALSDIDIVFTQNEKGINIFSVNNIENNKFGYNGGWYGYVTRDKSTLRPEDYLNISLKKNDIVVLYYGHVSGTKIINFFDFNETNGKVRFDIASNNTKWVEINGKWESEQTIEKLADVKIYITMPRGDKKILITNSEGSAETDITELGMYTFYAEGYQNGKYPSVVKTEELSYFYGISNENAVTRGEAAAFIVNLFNINKTEEVVSFYDVNEDYPYRREIEIAASRGIISGYEDGSFRPYQPISLLQLGVMISKMYDDELPNEIYNDEKYSTIPEWARPGIYKLVNKNIFKNIDYELNNIVTEDILIRIYNSIMN